MSNASHFQSAFTWATIIIRRPRIHRLPPSVLKFRHSVAAKAVVTRTALFLLCTTTERLTCGILTAISNVALIVLVILQLSRGASSFDTSNRHCATFKNAFVVFERVANAWSSALNVPLAALCVAAVPNYSSIQSSPSYVPVSVANAPVVVANESRFTSLSPIRRLRTRRR